MSLVSTKNFKNVNAEQPHTLNPTPKALGGLNQGPRDLNGDGKVDALEKWANDFKGWLAKVRDSGQQDQVDWNQSFSYIQYTSSKLGVNWDPMSELGWHPAAAEGFDMGDGEATGVMSDPGNGPLQNLTWVNSNSIIPFQATGNREDVWDANPTIVANNLAAELTSAEITSDGLQPPHNVLKIILTDNSLKPPKQEAYFFHNYEKNAVITLKTADGKMIPQSTLDQINQKIGPAKIVETLDDGQSDINGAASTLGTPAPEKKDGTYVWEKSSSVDMTPTAGTEPFQVNADHLNINITNRSWTVKITKQGAGVYDALILDKNGKEVRKIHAEGIDDPNGLNIEGADDHKVLYKDSNQKSPPSQEPQDPNLALIPNFNNTPGVVFNPGKPDPNAGDRQNGFRPWDEAHTPDPAVLVNGKGDGSTASGSGGAGSGKVVNPNAVDDTAADEVNDDTAKYNTQSEVNLTANYDASNKVTDYKIEQANTVHLSKAANGDKVAITKTPNVENDYTIVFTSADGKHTQTFHVQASKIVLNATITPVNNVTYNGEPYVPGIDPQISVEDESSVPKLPKGLQQLMSATGKTLSETLQILATNFPELDVNDDGTVSMEELSQGQFPPSEPNVELIEFLFDMDPKFQTELKAVKDAIVNKGDKAGAHKNASLRLITLLKQIYNTDPTNPVTIEMAEPSAGWDRMNDIMFNGQKFDYTREDDGNWKNWDPDSGDHSIIIYRNL